MHARGTLGLSPSIGNVKQFGLVLDIDRNDFTAAVNDPDSHISELVKCLPSTLLIKEDAGQYKAFYGDNTYGNIAFITLQKVQQSKQIAVMNEIIKQVEAVIDSQSEDSISNQQKYVLALKVARLLELYEIYNDIDKSNEIVSPTVIYYDSVRVFFTEQFVSEGKPIAAEFNRSTLEPIVVDYIGQYPALTIGSIKAILQYFKKDPQRRIRKTVP